MTVVEFLHPLKSASHRDLCIAALYHERRFAQKESMTVEEIRVVLSRGRIPRANKINIADALSKAAPYVHTAGTKGKAFLWAITGSGEDYVRNLLGLSKHDIDKVHDTAALESLVSTIPNQEVSDYINESLKCLGVDALRAAVVFLWAGAIRAIQERMLAKGTGVVSSAVQKHDPKSRTIGTIDDFAYIKEGKSYGIFREARLEFNESISECQES